MEVGPVLLPLGLALYAALAGVVWWAARVLARVRGTRRPGTVRVLLVAAALFVGIVVLTPKPPVPEIRYDAVTMGGGQLSPPEVATYQANVEARHAAELARGFVP